MARKYTSRRPVRRMPPREYDQGYERPYYRRERGYRPQYRERDEWDYPPRRQRRFRGRGRGRGMRRNGMHIFDDTCLEWFTRTWKILGFSRLVFTHISYSKHGRETQNGINAKKRLIKKNGRK